MGRDCKANQALAWSLFVSFFIGWRLTAEGAGHLMHLSRTRGRLAARERSLPACPGGVGRAALPADGSVNRFINSGESIMSRRFTPLSTAIAVATASLIIGIAGCASSRTSDEPAGLSQDADTKPTLAEATPTNPLDRTSEPNAVDTSTTVAMPAETPAPAAPVASIEPQPAQTSDAMPSSPPATDVSAAPAIPAQTQQTYPADTSSSSATTSSTADTSNSSYNSNADQALPPRRDRH
jgi:hypothetical protein